MTPTEEILLDSRLADLDRALRTVHPPAALEARLVQRFREHPPRIARPAMWWMPPLALAATIALATWIVRAPSAVAPAIVPPGNTALADDPGPFLALRPLEGIGLEPATVVKTQIPRALLAQWGLPVAPDRAAEPVRAEMLYSSDGEPLAVRLLD
ncbi:MAG: hypothetical protein ACM3X5_07215 [Bacillota bacterium]